MSDDNSGAQSIAAQIGWLKLRVAALAERPDEPLEWAAGGSQDAAATAFVRGDADILVAHRHHADGAVQAANTVPVDPVGVVLYFLRPETHGQPLSEADMSKVVWGEIRSGAIDGLYRVMSAVYQPALLHTAKWPESIKREFRSHMHRFMASLTETAHQVRGCTLLYVPSEPISSIEEALANKDLVQIFEATLIHWTRQIKEAIASHENVELADNAGPLAELEFWQSRAADLSSIRDQITDDRVRTILQVLQASKSSYVEQFAKLSDLIQQGSLEAQDNLRFLSVLQEPCKALALAAPREIPDVLPQIVHRVRFICAHSTFYNTPERVIGLLTKVSNEIINRCTAKISLHEIFDGDVDTSIVDLNDSVSAMESWRRLYYRTKAAMARVPGGPQWDFAETSVFAYLDAFIKRCKDLLEVCEGQVQFARKKGASKEPIPSFGGAHGPEVTKSLTEIERSFERQVQQLKALKYGILDVKATRWHDDFNAFLRSLKDLELMTQNVINNAFENATTVASGVELALIFKRLAQRDSIVRTVEKKANEVFLRFLEDLGRVKEILEHGRTNPPIDRNHPPFAGAAMWALSLKRRVERQFALFPEDFAVGSQERGEAQTEYNLITSALQDFVTKSHTRWVNSIEEGVAEQLNRPIMVRDADNLLEANFSKSLLKLVTEVYHWRQLGMEVPAAISTIYEQRESLRVLRENVMIAVREYNAIWRSLAPAEQRLFGERIKELDKTAEPGLESLTWLQPEAVFAFLDQWREHTNQVHKLVAEYKRGCAQVEENARLIGEMQLASIKKKVFYRSNEFLEKQQAHRRKAIEMLTKLHTEIRDVLLKVHGMFKSDPQEVQKEWTELIGRFDTTIEASLLQCVKLSLHEIAYVIVGDDKSEIVPFLHVNATLVDAVGAVFKPAFEEVREIIMHSSQDVIETTSVVPRLVDVLPVLRLPKTTIAVPAEAGGTAAPEEPAGGTKSFHDVIKADTEVTKILNNIEGGIKAAEPLMAAYLQSWEKEYKSMWEGDKDSYIRRYSKPVRPLKQFEDDITRYQDAAAQIEKLEGITTIAFMRVDCSPLKVSLVGHCSAWQSKFTGLLYQLASKELHDLHEMFENIVNQLKTPPRSLETLKTSIDLHKEMLEEQAKIEARFEPLDAMFRTLKKFEVQIDPADVALRESLPTAWTSFKQTLVDTDSMIKQKKDRFKSELVKAVKEFGQTVANARQDFMQKGPTTSNIPVDKAFKLIAEFRTHIESITEKDNSLKAGLEIFGMDTPQNKELAAMVKDLDMLEKIWQLTDEWAHTWEEWRTIRFSEITIAKMEEEAQQYQKKMIKLGKDIKGLEVWVTLKERIDQFCAGLPLIQDLKNPALRPRHWDRLKEEVGKPFDPEAADFTLDMVFALGLDGYADVISNLSSSATKELAIEESIKEIADTWEKLDLDLVPHKDTGHFRLHSCDDIFQVLDEHKVILADMKASHFFFAFEAQVEHWEKTLSHILETLETMLRLQRLWLYLESIFTATEDIRRQLPAESAIFDKVDHNWKIIMEGLAKTKNALRGTHADGLLEDLQDMNSKLEKIQHSLNQYLEDKRRSFPRFYFISDHDLLEVLGNSKDPNAIQRHLHNCFDNINQLELSMTQMGKDKKRWEALKMISAEGEEVTFLNSVMCEGGVETWLQSVEEQMIKTLNKELYHALIGFSKFKKDKQNKQDKFLKHTPGQLIITSAQITWTQNCVKALTDLESGGDKNALGELRKKQGATLHRLSDMVRGQLTQLSRLKLVALLTIEIHHRDIIERLIRDGITSEKDFAWRSQLRFVWEKDEEECYVHQTDFKFQYGYEYLGNTGRLVVTPLTEKAYLAMTTALMLKKGGSPQGPAGTGKTETVKDLGKALAKYVLVHNCSDKVDVHSMGRALAGLVQTGSWSCFDEFNRIDTNVLSVVAIQISAVLNAISAGKRRFIFPMFEEIVLKPGSGIFVTMNPTYAGRSELPDNLKALFRPVVMMAPDFSMIAEIILFSEGFKATKVLSRKIVTLYQLASQQLSKQDHYDFTLRSIKSVLVAAGTLKRKEPEMPEELVLLRSLRDMNLPKFTLDDVKLFLAILAVLFPGAEAPDTTSTFLQMAIESEIQEQGLQPHSALMQKIVQLYETKLTRHGTMVVGKTGSGKTTCWKTLSAAMTRLNKKEKVQGFNAVKPTIISPKALTMDEMYGAYDLKTHEWTEGIVSTIMRNCSADTKPEEKWIVFDGPVDTIWIESMNSVLDDNKVLTPVNGERIYLAPLVSLLFEVEDLKQASPATVSRCGMIYMEAGLLGWRPYVESWINKRPEAESREILRTLFNKYVQQALDFRARECVEIVPTTHLNAVVSLCNLFESLATAENGVNPGDADFYHRMIELWFLFSLIWSIGASVTEESRKKIDMFLREIEGQFPRKDTVYEYYVDAQKRGWALWEEKLSSGWKYNPEEPFHSILVPTVDTLRNSYLISALAKCHKHVLLVGNTGTGKTAIVQSVLTGPIKEQFNSITINFSAQTSAVKLQEYIMTHVDKRTMYVFVPRGGKKLVLFVDDLNMPQKDQFGVQPPLELIRQWIDYGFWYDRQQIAPNYIKDMQLVCAMAPPGGGRSEISPRLQSRFNLINVTFPDESQLRRIYGTIINQKLQDFEEEVKPIGEQMTQATMEIYQTVVATLLPTPAKTHYMFNLRDMSKVFQGLLQAQKDYHDSAESMIKLWVHECMRVFYDRLADDADRQWFQNLLGEKLASVFNNSWVKLFKDAHNQPLFTELSNIEEPVYREQDGVEAVRTALDTSLEEYNVSAAMDLVLFKDAIQHVCRIHRIIKHPRGHALLIGLGGSGRQSLCKLATHVAGCKLFTVDIRKGFRESDLRERLKELYHQAGIDEKQTVFQFSDTQVLRRGFLEDISSILSSGEVPNLHTDEERAQICDSVRASLEQAAGSVAKGARAGLDADSLYTRFIERSRNNIRVILIMSPVGDKFRDYCRLFPAIINCTTIDWFCEWPADALREVARKSLEGNGLDDLIDPISSAAQGIHQMALILSDRMRAELKRDNYVTPSNYLELLRGFKELLLEKKQLLQNAADKLESGLKKLDDTRTRVEELGENLREMQRKGAKLQQECDEALVTIVQQKQEASEQAKEIELQEQKLTQEEADIKEETAKARVELERVLPTFEAAKKALKALDRRDLGEIRTYQTPQPLMEKVMEAVLVLRHSTDFSWAEAKRQLADTQFIPQLLNYNIETVTDSILRKIDKYCMDPEFKPEKVVRVSVALMSLCQWVHAVDKCSHAQREVAPKQQALSSAQENLDKNQRMLEEARSNLKQINEKLETLRADHAAKVAQRDQLVSKAKETEVKINRASRLITGLSSERSRWETSIAQYRDSIAHLPGDCLIAAAYMSYAGPFQYEYRQDFLLAHPRGLLSLVKEFKIPHSGDFNFSQFLVEKVKAREWNSHGLPTDPFSIENGVLVTRGKRWPLIIDPEGQANRWIKSMERTNNLKVISPNNDDFMRTLELAIHNGNPVLMQDVHQDLDPCLDPILSRKLVKVGTRYVLRLDEGKEIEYNPAFRFYITTKLANPQFGPEITTKTCVVNFAVREQGLEQQLLGTVVQHEKRDLEEQKNSLVVNISQAQKTLVDLEERILHLLNTAQGSLLENETLVDALESAKKTAGEMKKQLEVFEQNESKIDSARHAYLPCAIRASVLFFVLKDLALVDSMYQFSLDSYVQLYERSLDKSPKSDELQDRIKNLNEFHTLNVYRTTCRALFEKHKTLFSFHMCVKILSSEKRFNKDEYQFFLQGGQVLSRESQMPNPCSDWLPEHVWDNITVLDRMQAFRNLATSFEQNVRDWKDWYFKAEPENIPLPGEWENKCNELEHLIIIRCFRSDRLISAVNTFIAGNLDPKFIDPPPFDPLQAYEDSTPTSPLLFILAPGADPLDTVTQLAAALGMSNQLKYHALGQGQESRALHIIEEGVGDGSWVFLANCHLMTDWLPHLDKLLEELQLRKVNERFRLWLSSKPHPAFPITILQRAVKITTQPPKGLKQNLMRMFKQITDTALAKCSAPTKLKKMLFALSFLHSVLLERHKFLTLGFNCAYDFNDSDFTVSQELLGQVLDTYEEVPWQAVRYIISELNYGGRVTDRWDSQVLAVYAKKFFAQEALVTPNYRLSSLPTYFIPEDGPLTAYRDYIASLPLVDKPEAFGQHSNADVASQIQESTEMLLHLLALQPRTGGGGGGAAPAGGQAAATATDRDQKLLARIDDLQKHLPELIGLEVIAKMKKEDGTNPLVTVLSHEVDRYNDLLRLVRSSLSTLQKGLKGLVVMSSELDEVSSFISEGRVPPAWKSAYPSLRPLAGWMHDLCSRIEMFSQWAQDKQPKVFWLGGFTYPTGFLTALLQKTALKNNLSIDTLTWEFSIVRDAPSEIHEAPAEGAYVTGMLLEGASWDQGNQTLREPTPMELECVMPVVHFRPVEAKKKAQKDPNTVYNCPCYFYPVRDSSSRPSYMLTVELPSGKEKPDHWTLRGTALLLSNVSQAEGVPASILDHLVDAFGPRESTPFAALTGDVEQIQARLGVVINGELRLREKFAPDAAPGALVEMLALYKRVFVQTKEAGARVLVNPVLATALRKVERVFVFTEHQMESAPLPTTKLHVHGFLDHLSARPFKGSEVGNPGSRPHVPFFCTVEAKSIVVGIATHMEQLFAEMLSMVQANAGSDPSKSPSGYVFGALTDGTSYRFYAVQVDKPGPRPPHPQMDTSTGENSEAQLLQQASRRSFHRSPAGRGFGLASSQPHAAALQPALSRVHSFAVTRSVTPESPKSTCSTPEERKKKKLSGIIGRGEIEQPGSESFKAEYEVIGALGEGATCKVMLGRNRKTSELVAVKMIPNRRIEDRNEFSLIAKEIPILKQLSHPNIIRYHDVFFTQNDLVIVLEYASGHELFEEIVARRAYSEREATMVAHKVLSALAYLHLRGIVHADLKPENIIINCGLSDDTMSLKLIDFGLAHRTDKPIDEAKRVQGRGTLGYRAPELFGGEMGAPAADMWAMGVILFIMLYGRPPFLSHAEHAQDEGLLMNAPFWFFFNEDTEELRQSISAGRYEFPDEPYVSELARDFIERLLRVDPAERLTALQALRHPWLLLEHATPNTPKLDTGGLRTKLETFFIHRPAREVLVNKNIYLDSSAGSPPPPLSLTPRSNKALARAHSPLVPHNYVFEIAD
eukprot:m51a1_g9670 putative dynein heavy chain axonemal (5182) ;mRNA; r:1243469-1265072